MEPSFIRKQFASAFILDRTKLSRIVSIIVDSSKGANQPMELDFELIHRNNKRVSLNDVDALLQLDNPVRNAIRTLTIKASSRIGAATDTDCSIEFDDDGVSLSVIAGDYALANKLFDELEEQIGRTLTPSWVHVFTRSPGSLIAAFASVALIPLFGLLLVLRLSLDLGVPGANLLPAARNAQTLEQKVDFLFELQRAHLEHSSAGGIAIDWGHVFTWPKMCVALPLIVILGCISYLLARCYPKAVFMWGDCAEHYAALFERRRYLWNAVIGALVFEILASMFVFGVSELAAPRK